MKPMLNTLAEQRNALKLERRYMVNSSRKVYTALEDMNFHWDYDQVKEFQKMWKKGFSLAYMADYFDRPQEEVAVLLIDRAMLGNVKARKNGIW